MQKQTHGKTYKQSINKFFNQDFKRLLAFSGRRPIDLAPNNAHKLHTLDETNTDPQILYASQVTTCISQALAACTNEPRRPFQHILISCYLKDELNYKIRAEIGYCKTQYCFLKKQAAAEFVARFIYYQKKAGISPIIELKP